MSSVFTYLRNKEWTDFSKSNSNYRKEKYLTHSLTRCVRIYLWCVLLNNGQWIHPTPHYCTCWYPGTCACLVYHFSSTAIEYICFFYHSRICSWNQPVLGKEQSFFPKEMTVSWTLAVIQLTPILFVICTFTALPLSRRVLYSICAIVLFSWINCCSEMYTQLNKQW